MTAAWGAGVAETHISVVFFFGAHAYKIKKPVDFGFVNLTTREARRELCQREVELNRRLAPDVYLGVADIVAEDGSPCDHLVVMRRMPAERRLATLVQSGEPIDDAVRAVARLVADFHERCHSSATIAEAGSADRVSANWEAGFRQMGSAACGVLDPRIVARCQGLARRYVAGRRPLFQARMRDGRIRDGHGDLLADDIFCLDDGPRVLDCIEFDDRLRHCDVLADVAFLAMDLERLGAHALATRFLAWYREFSAETWPASLAHHYLAYRAQIRSKVALLRVTQGDSSAAKTAQALLALCATHLERARVRLVMVGGAPGTGKSTLARGVAERTGAVVLRSDDIRTELLPAGDRYGERAKDLVYREMLCRAGHALALGETVVLDATFAREAWRSATRDVAAETVSDLTELQCVVPTDVAAWRVAARAATGDDPSEATAEVARSIAAQFDPWPSALAIPTDRPTDASLDAAVAGLSLEGAPS